MTTQSVVQRVIKQESIVNSLEQDEKCIILIALGNQIPKKPYRRSKEGAEGYACPSCNMGVDSANGMRVSYCHYCGQAIDWSEE